MVAQGLPNAGTRFVVRRARALIGAVLWACQPRERPPTDLPNAPEILNTRVVFAPQCRRVLFSSNRHDHMAAFALDVSSATPAVIPVGELRGRDLLVRSVSPDCAMLALVADYGGNELFDVFLYDFSRRELEALTRSRRTNEGDPEFSPTQPLLAYLSDGTLRLYEYQDRRPVPVPDSPARFTSVRWSARGDRAYLEDRRTHLWEYDPAQATFRVIWKAPTRAYSPRLVHSTGDSVYFLSDHETGLSQIYQADVHSWRPRRVHPSSHDQYSPRTYGDGLLFRSSIDGNFPALRLRGGRVDTLSPSRGVVYDFSLEFPSPLFVYAGEGRITSIYAGSSGNDTLLRDLLNHDFAPVQPRAREFRTSEGMVHFVFAADSVPRRWVVWLHGGPREQVSPRFNLYFDFLVRLGYAVVALNYPGSTGIGNEYELPGLPDSAQVTRQLAGIEEGLGRVRELYPGFDRYALVGVSYGSAIGFLHARRHPGEVLRFVDFSGVTTPATAVEIDSGPAPLPPVLLIQGANDAQQRTPERRALLRDRGEATRTTRLLLREEGHYVARMSSVRLILAHLERFLTETTP